MITSEQSQESNHSIGVMQKASGSLHRAEVQLIYSEKDQRGGDQSAAGCTHNQPDANLHRKEYSSLGISQLTL